MKTKVFRKKPSMIFRNPDVPCCFFSETVPPWLVGVFIGKSPARGHENVQKCPQILRRKQLDEFVEDQSGAFN